MTTADKLLAIEKSKNDIKEALKRKGVFVSDTDTFASYSDKIQNLDTSGFLNNNVNIPANAPIKYLTSSYTPKPDFSNPPKDWAPLIIGKPLSSGDSRPYYDYTGWNTSRLRWVKPLGDDNCTRLVSSDATDKTEGTINITGWNTSLFRRSHTDNFMPFNDYPYNQWANLTYLDLSGLDFSNMDCMVAFLKYLDSEKNNPDFVVKLPENFCTDNAWLGTGGTVSAFAHYNPKLLEELIRKLTPQRFPSVIYIDNWSPINLFKGNYELQRIASSKNLIVVYSDRKTIFKENCILTDMTLFKEAKAKNPKATLRDCITEIDSQSLGCGIRLNTYNNIPIMMKQFKLHSADVDTITIDDTNLETVQTTGYPLSKNIYVRNNKLLKYVYANELEQTTPDSHMEICDNPMLEDMYITVYEPFHALGISYSFKNNPKLKNVFFGQGAQNYTDFPVGRLKVPDSLTEIDFFDGCPSLSFESFRDFLIALINPPQRIPVHVPHHLMPRIEELREYEEPTNITLVEEP